MSVYEAQPKLWGDVSPCPWIALEIKKQFFRKKVLGFLGFYDFFLGFLDFRS